MTSEYTVYIDESFWQWFGLPIPEANFCYAALSIPTAKISDLERFECAISQYGFQHLNPEGQIYRQQHPNSEFKYTHFRFLDNETIDVIGSKIAYFLEKNKGYIFGYYIPAEGYLNYQLRGIYSNDAGSLRSMSPDEKTARIKNIKDDLISNWNDASHNLGLLIENFRTFFNFIVQFHGQALHKSFCIVYDSRNPSEDVALQKAAEEFAAIADRASPGVFSYYKGFSTSSSSSSAGIRVADLIAGEIRAFFVRHPSVYEGNSKWDILSPYINPDMLLVDGVFPCYRKALPQNAIDFITRTGGGFMMPHLKKYFASDLLTYYAKHGEARHLSMYDMMVYDLPD